MVELTGEYDFPVAPVELWRALQDAELLARVLPGCQRLEKVGENEFQGDLKIAVGPVQGAFQGAIIYTEMQPPASLRLTVNTRGPSGIVNGEGTLLFIPTETGVRLQYQGQAQVGGRIATVSQRLMTSSANAITKQSLQSLEKQVTAQARPAVETVEQRPSSSEAPPAPGQTEFMLGVAQEVLEDFIPDPRHRRLLAGLAALAAVLALLEWFANRLARKMAKQMAAEMAQAAAKKERP